MKKLISAALASAMVLSLAACGSTDTGNTSSAGADNAATAEASNSNGFTPIKLGGIGPTTGSAASYGIAVWGTLCSQWNTCDFRFCHLHYFITWNRWTVDHSGFLYR